MGAPYTTISVCFYVCVALHWISPLVLVSLCSSLLTSRDSHWQWPCYRTNYNSSMIPCSHSWSKSPSGLLDFLHKNEVLLQDWLFSGSWQVLLLHQLQQDRYDISSVYMLVGFGFWELGKSCDAHNPITVVVSVRGPKVQNSSFRCTGSIESFTEMIRSKDSFFPVSNKSRKRHQICR